MTLALFSDLRDLGAALGDAWASRFGDPVKDLLTLENVAAVLSDLGAPDARLAEVVLALLVRAAELKQAAGPDDQGEYWFYHPGPRVER